MAETTNAVTTPMRPSLGNVLRGLLRNLGLEDQELAKRLNVSRPVVSNWMTGQRRPTRDNLWQIAQVLGEAAATAPGRPTERLDASAILLALMRAGDYEIGNDAEGYDVIHERYLRDLTAGFGMPGATKLTVGWAKAPPYMTSSDRNEVENTICGRVADRVIRALGAEPAYVELEWHRLIPALGDGDIDVIAPILMRVPTRASQALFTDSIGLIAGYRILLQKKRKPHLFRKDPDGREAMRSELLRVLPVKGEVGQLFCHFKPNAEILAGSEMGGGQGLESLGAAAEKLTQLRDDMDYIPCLITEIVTCHQLTRDHEDLDSVELPSDVPMWFPLAFAVHPKERKLCNLINLEIKNLRDSGTLREWFVELLGAFAVPDPRALLVDPDLPRLPVGAGKWMETAGRSEFELILNHLQEVKSPAKKAQKKETP